MCAESKRKTGQKPQSLHTAVKSLHRVAGSVHSQDESLHRGEKIKKNQCYHIIDVPLLRVGLLQCREWARGEPCGSRRAMCDTALERGDGAELRDVSRDGLRDLYGELCECA